MKTIKILLIILTLFASEVFVANADMGTGGVVVTVTTTLTVTKAGAGGGTVTSNPTGISCGSTCTKVYNKDTAVTLTASPSAGSTFGGWSGDCNASGQVTMSTNKSCTATFNASAYPA